MAIINKDVQRSSLVVGGLAAACVVAVRRRRIPVREVRTMSEYFRLALHEGPFSHELPFREWGLMYIQSAITAGVASGVTQHYFIREQLRRVQNIIVTKESNEAKSLKISQEFSK
jgi:hypothetical protein